MYDLSMLALADCAETNNSDNVLFTSEGNLSIQVKCVNMKETCSVINYLPLVIENRSGPQQQLPLTDINTGDGVFAYTLLAL